MNLEQLEYVIEVAKMGTISKAAEKLHVSHSAISQSISSLESELGIVIFKRSRSGSICTEEGKKVLKIANEVINKSKELKELGYKSSTLKGTLRISAASIFFTTLLPEILYSFKQAFPYIQLVITEDHLHEIEESVKNNEVDIGLTYVQSNLLNRIDPALSYRVLYETKYMVCVSKNSILAYHDKITPEEIIQHQHPLALRNEKAIIRFWENSFSKYGKVNILLYSNNNDVIKNVIANDLAIGIYTDFWVRQDYLIQKGDIVPIPFEYNEAPMLSLIYIQAKNKHVSIAENEFLKFLTQRFDEYKLRLK
jgi:DNA-binding transcriptional LysR family regulator